MVYCFFFTDWQANIFNASSKNHTTKGYDPSEIHDLKKGGSAFLSKIFWVGAKILKSQSRGLESCNFFLPVQQH